jgi:hypothetical protein
VIPLVRTACHRAGLSDVEHFPQGWFRRGARLSRGATEAPRSRHNSGAVDPCGDAVTDQQVNDGRKSIIEDDA